MFWHRLLWNQMLVELLRFVFLLKAWLSFQICATNMDTELVQVLAESGIREVPPSFVQHVEKPVDGEGFIPVLDMQAILNDSSDELSKLSRACEEWGFFQVVNHGIPTDVISSMKRVSKEFFQLPLEEKQKLARDPSGIKVEGYGRFNTSSDSVSDWVDVLVLYTAPPTMIVPSNWPSQPPAFRETTLRYSDEIQKFTLALVAAISYTLDLPPEYISETGGEYTSALRINYYPPCPQPEKALGVSSHSDGGTITVLVEGSETSKHLQVRKGEAWVSVDAAPNSLIVNVGDMLQVISNGKYRSVEHRAVVNSSLSRLSIVSFYYPSLSSGIPVAPAEKLVRDERALYKSINFSDYLMYYMTAKAPGKARVDSLRL